MLYIEKNKQGNTLAISCQLKSTSLEQMRCLTPAVGIGWILGALGHSIALSNRPGHQFQDTDALLKTIRIYISDFSEIEFNTLVECYSLADRATFISTYLISPTILSDTKTISKQITAGWLAFKKLGDHPTAYDFLQDFIKAHEANLSDAATRHLDQSL